jgi:AcrR family transcriptional regulator
MRKDKTPHTRDRIEQAAMRLFVDNGVAETTIRDIAGAVGLSEGALYRHFVSKEELVWAMFERHYTAFARRLEAVAAEQDSARDKVVAMIREFCRAHDADPTLFRFLLFVQHGQLAKLAPDALTPVSVVRDVLAAAIAAGDIPAQRPELATALVFGAVLEPAQFAAYGSLPSVMAPLGERLADAAWAAVTAVPAA